MYNQNRCFIIMVTTGNQYESHTGVHQVHQTKETAEDVVKELVRQQTLESLKVAGLSLLYSSDEEIKNTIDEMGPHTMDNLLFEVSSNNDDIPHYYIQETAFYK